MQLLFRTTALTLIALFVAACGVNVNIEDGNLVVSSNFSLSETMLNSSDNTTLSFGETDFIRDGEYDIQDGQLVITGDVLCADSTRSDGAVTITMSTTESGFIDVQITDVEAGCDYDESLVTEAQDELANGLADAARELEQSDATITFNELTLADDTLTISLEVRAPIDGGNGQ